MKYQFLGCGNSLQNAKLMQYQRHSMFLKFKRLESAIISDVAWDQQKWSWPW